MLIFNLDVVRACTEQNDVPGLIAEQERFRTWLPAAVSLKVTNRGCTYRYFVCYTKGCNHENRRLHVFSWQISAEVVTEKSAPFLIHCIQKQKRAYPISHRTIRVNARRSLTCHRDHDHATRSTSPDQSPGPRTSRSSTWYVTAVCFP